ncbi:hypothetical protein [Pseudogracilibacillus auburnensis]|uniref:hypothetical protein n=1 Tax=Pseudogracilibacillus auburnensis TaxID=1494959 RepID=UPI001A97B131|nr:hypothetical protein [Pseudogracilibacillus auburnensis]MBO1001216.1 hypothetical protein [Pseudogracilibacillus auburnensis]
MKIKVIRSQQERTFSNVHWGMYLFTLPLMMQLPLDDKWILSLLACALNIGITIGLFRIATMK